jgi:cytochrome c peroxidase
MKYKTRDYWYADAAPDDATHFAINFTTPHAQMNENHAEHVALVAKALAFARETQPPPFPGKIDADLVQRGADLFHGRTPPADKTGFVSCKTCHGTYSKRDGHADLSQPGHWAVDYPHSEVLRNVKTDSAYNDALQKFAPLVEHMQKLETYYASAGTPELTPKVRAVVKAGYVAPPLVGVWATAPYFHNGSVPTVEAVLHSPSRPTIWAREHRDPHAYDLEKVGMRFRVLTLEESQAAWNEASQKPDRSRPRIDLAAIYDTTAFGRANTGHTFGDHLTADERSAVIEFLKSLSGNGM